MNTTAGLLVDQAGDPNTVSVIIYTMQYVVRSTRHVPMHTVEVSDVKG